MVAKDHSGHFGNGIQAHSAGPTYPWRVLTVGNFCVAFNGETGREGNQAYPFNAHGRDYRQSYELAERDCARFLSMSTAVLNFETCRANARPKVA